MVGISMKKIGFGLIGAGKHGSRYARHICQDIEEAELVALCRRSREEGEKIAQEYHCTYYPDYRELIADKRVRAIVVAVPPALHGSMVTAACREGKSLLIEKPFAVSMAEGKSLCELVSSRGVLCMVAHTLRFNSVVQAMRARIPDIAPLHTLYLSQRFEPSTLPWLDRRKLAGGGIVLHTGVHSFDLLRFFSGLEVEEVHCQTKKVFTQETEDNFVMTCRMREASVSGAVMGSRSTQSRSGLIELSGERGQLIGDHTHGFAYQLKGYERTLLPVASPTPTVREVLRVFVESLKRGNPPPITAEDGLKAVVVAEACYRSAATGQPAKVQV
jgi:predicted dehydrogenase